MMPGGHQGSGIRDRRAKVALQALALALLLMVRPVGAADSPLPQLTQPVNDFAHVIDAANAAAIDQLSRALIAASGDVVIVETTPTVEPYADIKEYANRLFENQGSGIGAKGKDNGVLIVLAVKEHQVWIEVGYGLEQFVTDGFAGETSRQVMVPEFRGGRYGAGLRAGVERIVARIAQGRGVTLQGVPVSPQAPQPSGDGIPFWVFLLIFIAILLISRFGGGPGAPVRRWGGGPWSGWSSGVGPFGGGWSSGGGFGGGFGGFGGGRSGGGGGGAGW